MEGVESNNLAALSQGKYSQDLDVEVETVHSRNRRGILFPREDDIPRSGYRKIVASSGAFCAVHLSGQVVAYGDSGVGGEIPSGLKGFLSERIVDVVATRGAFAALRDDGRVFVWGEATKGGEVPATKKNSLLVGIVSLHASKGAFAALNENGGVVAWGDPDVGGDMATLELQLTKGVELIHAHSLGFAAVCEDSITRVWGVNGLTATASGELTKFVATSSAFYGALSDGALWSSDLSVVAQSGVVDILAFGSGVVTMTKTKACYYPAGAGVYEPGECTASPHVSACSQRVGGLGCTQKPCAFGTGGASCELSLLREGFAWNLDDAVQVKGVDSAESCSSRCDKSSTCMGWTFLQDLGSGLEESCLHFTTADADKWTVAGKNAAVQLILHDGSQSACSRRWLQDQQLSLSFEAYTVRKTWCEQGRTDQAVHEIARGTVKAPGKMFHDEMTLTADACELLCEIMDSCSAWTHRSTICSLFAGTSFGSGSSDKVMFDDGIGGHAMSGIVASRSAATSAGAGVTAECPPGRTGVLCSQSYVHRNTVYQYNAAGVLENYGGMTMLECADKCAATIGCSWWTYATSAKTCTLWKTVGSEVFTVIYDEEYISSCSSEYVHGTDKTLRQCWREPPTPVVVPSAKCVVPDAEVCAYDWYTGAKVLCETTSSEGTYLMEIPIGLNVEFVATFGMHDIVFQSADVSPGDAVKSELSPLCTNTPTIKSSFVVMPEEGLTGVNFLDETMEKLTITVAGGSPQCNMDLGTAEIRLLPRFTCDAPDVFLTVIQEAVVHTHVLPATMFDVVMNKVYERPEVAPYLDRIQTRTYSKMDLRIFDEKKEEDKISKGLLTGELPQLSSHQQKLCDKDVPVTADVGQQSDADKAESEAVLAEAESADREREIRYEFHTRPQILIKMDNQLDGAASADACVAKGRKFPTILGNGVNVSPGTVKFSITAQEVYGDKAEEVCHFVEGSLRIVNTVGTTTAVSAAKRDITGDAMPVSAAEAESLAEDPVLVNLCGRYPGCVAKLTIAKSIGNTPLPSDELPPMLVVDADTADPERNAAVMSADTPHTRPLYVTMNVPGWDTLDGINFIEMDVALVGQVELSAFFSLQLPEYLPLMIVRDPPGGDSSATVGAGKSVAWAWSKSLSVGGGLGVQADLASATKNDIMFCAGFGAMVCKNGFNLKTVAAMGRRDAELAAEGIVTDGDVHERETRAKYKVKIKPNMKSNAAAMEKASAAQDKADKGANPLEGASLGYSFDRTASLPSDNWEKSREVSMTYTVSTSDNLGTAGRAADMYLVPSLSVKLTRSLNIKYDAAECEMEAEPVVVVDPEGDQVMAWKSEDDLRYRQLPDLLKQLHYEIENSGLVDTKKRLANAVNGWINILAYNGAVHHVVGQKTEPWTDFEEEMKMDPQSFSPSSAANAVNINSLFTADQLGEGVNAINSYMDTVAAYAAMMQAWKDKNKGLYGSSKYALPPINSLKLQSGVKKFNGDEEESYTKKPALVPDEWADRAGKEPQEWTEDTPIEWRRESTRSIAEAEAADMNTFNGISFSGGGADFSYGIGGASSDSSTDTEAWEHTLTFPSLKFGFKMNVGAGIEIGLTIPAAMKVSHGSTSTASQSDTHDMSFTLGDPEVGDQFDVLVRVES